ncbi:MAG: helix-turn-helix transcriptional regulator [Candidatus Eisenbacteria bacterium]
MTDGFGDFVRSMREERKAKDKRFSQRQVALRIGIEPSYLSKIERGQEVHLSEEKVVALARELDVDPDLLLALHGKVSSDLQEVIRRRPQLFAQLLRELKDLPDHAVLRLAREVRDGDW